jgi:hypothetical protein
MSTISDLRAKATPVKKSLNPWYGMNPIDAGFDAKAQAEEIEFASFINQYITILGFSTRKSDTEKFEHGGEFAVIFMCTDASDQGYIVTTGASVVMKKLIDANENNLLPIRGKLVKIKGDKFSYFDLLPE